MQQSGERQCSACGTKRREEDLFVVDGDLMCAECLFGELAPVRIHPIGFVHNTQRRDGSDFGLRDRSSESRIELLASQKRFMYKLEDEDCLTVVYHLHKARSIRSRFKRGLDGKEVGVFSSRTPDRLSPIGIQDVQLLRVEGTVLFVEGLDAIDGTPVLDLKLSWHRR